MRIREVREFLRTRVATDDVSDQFGVPQGTISAADVTNVIFGHEDMESVELTSDGAALVIRDRRNTKFGTFQLSSERVS